MLQKFIIVNLHNLYHVGGVSVVSIQR